MKLAIIVPAREGSKGIIHKNRQEINGISLFSHALTFANDICSAIAYPAKIIPATDDQVLLGQNSQHRTSYVRSPELSGDKTSMYELIVDVLSHFSNENFTDIIVLQPTTPQRTLRSFLKVWNEYLAKREIIGCVCGVSSIGIGLHELVINDEFNELIPLEDRVSDIRRQDQTKHIFYDDGSFYLLKVKELMEQRVSLPKPIAFVNSGLENVIDIDNMTDLSLARYFMGHEL